MRLNRYPADDDEVDAVLGERQQDLVGLEDAVRRRVHSSRGPLPWPCQRHLRSEPVEPDPVRHPRLGRHRAIPHRSGS